MAKSSIADVYVAILPTVDGITNQLKQEIQAIGNLMANAVARGLTEGVQNGGNTIQSTLGTVAQNAQQDFSQIFDGINIPVGQLNSQFSSFANNAGQSLQSSVSGSLNTAIQQSSGAAQSSFQNIFSNINIPTSNITSNFAQIANTAGSSVSGAMVGAVTGGAAAGSPILSATTSNAVSTGLQTGIQSGINASTATLNNGVAQATNGGAAEGFKKAGPAIIAAIGALGIGAAVTSSITSGLEKEAGQAKMTAALGLDPAAAKKAGEVAGNLYMNAYGDSMEEVQASTSAVLSSFTALQKGSSKEIEEVTKRALNMASVFEVDVARSTQVASQMITTGWAKDATGAMDMLSASMQKVPANVREDIMDAVDEYGPFMSELGLEGAKGMELFVAGAKKGMYGIDKTGDALKEFTIRAKDMSTASLEGYDLLGMSQEKASAALLKGGKTGQAAFNKIVDGLLKIKDPVKKQTAALSLFGTPLEDLSVNEIPKFLKGLKSTGEGLGDVGKAAKDMDDALNATSASTLTSFKRTLEMTFADALMPIVKEMLPMLTSLSKWFQGNKDQVGKWVRVVVDGVKYAVLPVIDAIRPLLKSIGDWFNGSKGDIAGWVKAFIDGLHNWLIPAIETVVGLLGGMFGWLSENEELLNKWVPVIAEIAAALVAVWAVFSIVQGLIAFVAAIKLVAGGIWAAFAASTAFNLSLGWVALLVIAVAALGFGIGTVLWNLIQNFDAVWAHIKGFFVSIMDAFKTLGDGSYNLLGMIGGVLMGIVTLLVNAIILVINTIPYVLNTLSIGLNSIFDMIPGFEIRIPMIPTLDYMQWNVPAMATGGDVMGPTVLLAGEKDPETIVNRGKMNDLIDNINGDWNSRGSSGETYITVTVNAGPTDTPEDLAWKVAKAVEHKQKR